MDTQRISVEADEVEIRGVLSEWAEALDAKDLDRLMACYTQGAVQFDAIPPYKKVGVEAIRSDLEHCLPCFPEGFKSEHREVTIRVSGDAAFVHGLYHIATEEPDHPAGQTWLRLTLGLCRIDGCWKIEHEHFSVPFNPMNNEAWYIRDPDVLDMPDYSGVCESEIGRDVTMVNAPKIESRDEIGYLGIRTLATMQQLDSVIPQLHDEVHAWMKAESISPCGPPFVRYFDVSNMEGELDIEMGWPVKEPLSGNDTIVYSTIPAGRYATVLYRGAYEDLERETAKLLRWAEERGIEWKMEGKEWVSRLEIFLNDPAVVGNPENLETELAFMVADEA